MEKYLQYASKMDDHAFRELMNEYGQEVWNYAYFLIRRFDAADDLVQEVFIRVYQNIGSFRGESSIKTWLFAITRNLAFNYKRSAFIRKVTLTDWIGRRESSPSAEKEALDQILTDDLWKIVLDLPDKYREILVLDARYGLSNKEIAGLLKISEGTVKSRLHRARNKVNEQMKEGIKYGII